MYCLWHGDQQESRYASTYETPWFGPDHVCSVFPKSLFSLIIYCRKLPYPWEGCTYSTLQKSNLRLRTRYRRQCVLFIFFSPPHRDWCILLLLAQMRNHLSVLTTPPAIANSRLAIRPHSSVIDVDYTTRFRLGAPSPTVSSLTIPSLPKVGQIFPPQRDPSGFWV